MEILEADDKHVFSSLVWNNHAIYVNICVCDLLLFGNMYVSLSFIDCVACNSRIWALSIVMQNFRVVMPIGQIMNMYYPACYGCGYLCLCSPVVWKCVCGSLLMIAWHATSRTCQYKKFL
jgi:hypothetical protein